MLLIINGESREVVNAIVLSELVSQLKLAADRVAIELNKRVIKRADWPSARLKEGDRIEIVHFVGGGQEAVGKFRNHNR